MSEFGRALSATTICDQVSADIATIQSSEKENLVKKQVTSPSKQIRQTQRTSALQSLSQIDPPLRHTEAGSSSKSTDDHIASQVPAEGGFQHFTVLKENVTIVIPDHISFEKGIVLPRGLSYAASAFFRDNPFLVLRKPVEPFVKSTGETILVWGGSLSVGSNAIKLAVAAGYEMVVTASAKNFEHVKNLGAGHSVD